MNLDKLLDVINEQAITPKGETAITPEGETPQENSESEKQTDEKSLNGFIKKVDEALKDMGVYFYGANNTVTSHARIKAKPKINVAVNSFSDLAKFIQQQTGVTISKKQAAAAYYYILYQIYASGK